MSAGPVGLARGWLYSFFLNKAERKKLTKRKLIYFYIGHIYISKFSGELILQRGHFSEVKLKLKKNNFLEIPNKIQI